MSDKEYTMGDLEEECQWTTKLDGDRYEWATGTELFLANKIVELTNRIITLEKLLEDREVEK